MDDLLAAVGRIRVTASGLTPEPVYAARMAATFPFRDGGCCVRVYDRIRAMTETEPLAAELALRTRAEEIRPYRHVPSAASVQARSSQVLGTGK